MDTENISKAISAHGRWKERLAHAIWSGRSDFNPDVVKLPDQCELGMWLYGHDISPGAKASAVYQRVVDVHAQFHVQASAVLSLALRGDMIEAEKLMAPGSQYDSLSTELVSALNEWKAH